MASFVRVIDKICRLCLSENEAILLPTSQVIDSTLTVDDIERCTGVRVEEEHVTYVICEPCHNKLQKFIAYRYFCLSNDESFRELFSSLCASERDSEAKPPSATFEHSYFRMDDGSEYVITDAKPTDGDYEEAIEAFGLEEHLEPEEHVEILEPTEQQNSDQGWNWWSATTPPSPSEAELSTEELEDIEPPQKPKKPRKPYVRRVTIGKEQDSSVKKPRVYKKPPNRNKLPKKLCTVCGKFVANLNHHLLSHTKERRFACTYCPGAFSRSSLLKVHVEAVHLKKTAKSCELCDRSFTHKSSYTIHMNTFFYIPFCKRAAHNIGEWYECKLCDLKFRHPGSLRDHNNRKHNVASNCECTICGMMFEDSYGLKKHGRVHSNEQPFACRYCPKRFKSPNAHRSHELIHQGVVFTCEYCTKTYRYKSLLNMHVKKEHKKQVAESETKNVEIHLGRKEREETTQAGKEW
ncbi:zinc finger protein 668-like isoform X1 [Anopheles merus]|uniref:zinc finger protein 668-like isoform X1 n=1 Tax=Anopheles merus TaxID=30066 RepID=UPI001BE47B36|nr:zinc finger protein 668-like isoform X1 [Anopheles merus]